jgi:hypothetical protein
MAIPKLHLRDFMWMAVVVGLVLGWWQERRARERDVRALKIQLLKQKAESADDGSGSEPIFPSETAKK